MYQLLLFLLIGLGSLLTVGCEEEKQPNNFAPEVVVHEVQDITRNSARLTGCVRTSQSSNTDRCRFRYGVTPEMETMCETPLKDSLVSVEINELTAGTTYYYCLEAGNATEWIQSTPSSFTTIPNNPPTVGKMQLLGRGPISILMRGELIDDGGEPITCYGFVCQTTDGKFEKEYTVEATQDKQWEIRIDQLEKMTEYSLRSFAENKIGRTYSEPYTFETGTAVELLQAGTLENIIGSNHLQEYEVLNIVGPLNGSDFRFIRAMGGKAYNGQNTAGVLHTIDLTDAEIVEGGDAYDASRFTKKNTATYGLFSELTKLKTVKLPKSTVSIERNAFKNCSSLQTIEIPAETQTLIPSEGCKSLSQLQVSPTNLSFKSIDGVLYSKNGENMIWYPEGIVADEIQWSDKLKSIAQLALQHCKIKKVVLPNSIQSIGKQAFMNAEIEEVVLPDGLIHIPHALFQHCNRLRSITIGSKCEILSSYCFDGCPLEHLYVKAVIPPVCESETFCGVEQQFKNCRLHVLRSSLPLYRNHLEWKQFEYIKGSL